MIRLIQRRLIIPRGNTGSFTVPTLVSVNEGDVAVFSIYDRLTHKTVHEIKVPATEGTITIPFEREDTINLEPKKYFWDITIYNSPDYGDDEPYKDNKDIMPKNGAEIHSYYAAYKLPICDIREVAENVSRT